MSVFTVDQWTTGFKRRFKVVSHPVYGTHLLGNQSERDCQRLERRWLDGKGQVVQVKADRSRLYYIQDCTWVPHARLDALLQAEHTDEEIEALLAELGDSAGVRRVIDDEALRLMIERDVDGGCTRWLMDQIRQHNGIASDEPEDASKN